MESLIINLTSTSVSTSKETEGKPDNVPVAEPNTLIDTEDDYKCEYKEEIWNNLVAQEAEKPTIHLQSPQLEFRGTLVQQMRNITKQLGLGIATLHSAVALLDLFMDSHRLRADRLTHVALACLSLAAKSEEKFGIAPTLKTLSKNSGVQLCGKTFRQLEWMVGQHVRWRLLSPTPVTFAALLSPYVVTDSDLTSRHPKFVRRFKKDGAKLLEAYLDLTLSDVRLKVVESVDVGCACVACARADLGLPAWPLWLVAFAGRKPTTVAPIARLLQRMMLILKSRDTLDAAGDMGYSSMRSSPDETPCGSPRLQASPASSTCSTSTSSYLNVDSSYRQLAVQRKDTTYITLEGSGPTSQEDTSLSEVSTAAIRNSSHSNDRASSTRFSQLDFNRFGDSNALPTVNVEGYYRLPTAVDVVCHRVNNPADYRYCISSRLLEGSLDTVPMTANVAVKRGPDVNLGLESKQHRLAQQV